MTDFNTWQQDVINKIANLEKLRAVADTDPKATPAYKAKLTRDITVAQAVLLTVTAGNFSKW